MINYCRDVIRSDESFSLKKKQQVHKKILHGATVEKGEK
jgi:hypothetical protein